MTSAVNNDHNKYYCSKFTFDKIAFSGRENLLCLFLLLLFSVQICDSY